MIKWNNRNNVTALPTSGGLTIESGNVLARNTTAVLHDLTMTTQTVGQEDKMKKAKGKVKGGKKC